MASVNDIGIFIGEERIGEVTPVDLVTSKETYKMEIYMRRGNKHYLRGDNGKIVFECEPNEDLKSIKRGTFLMCSFTV